ncbi:MAG: uracil-DNA glycosylase [Magnetococcales bacterium]|nr:uracil-DNA glycosylase [Magnetococcales bacterium]
MTPEPTLPAESLQAWYAATLAYWRECGLEFLTGDAPWPLASEEKPPVALVREAAPALEAEEPPWGASPLPASPSYPTARGGEATSAEPIRFARPSRPALAPSSAASPKSRPPAAPVAVAAPLVQLESLIGVPVLPPEEKRRRLEAAAREVAECRRCPLALTRMQTVYGVGSAEAEVVFVGEGPGAEEDKKGEPFVGAAGQLLDRMLAAVGMDRSKVYICNVVKCRPPGNRNPLPEEVAHCQGYLFDQLAVIRPRAIFCLGKFAAMTLLGVGESIGKARGRVYDWRGIPVVASFHPAYYLRTPTQKRAAWEDLLLLEKILLKPDPVGN